MKKIVLTRLSAALLSCLAVLLIGCSGYQYVASPRYVPLNEKKGQLTANIYPSGLQAGYAFSNKLSAFATGFMRFPSTGPSGSFFGLYQVEHVRDCESKEVNMGLSYFGKKGNLVYEVLVGGGFGDMSFNGEYEHSRSSSYARFNMQADRSNLFVQPNVGYKFNNERINKHLSIGVFTKFNSVHYSNIQSETVSNNSSEFDTGAKFFEQHTEANLFFIEPGIIVKGGAKKYKGMIQVSPVINAGGQAIRYQVYSISFGFTAQLELLKKKDKL